MSHKHCVCVYVTTRLMSRFVHEYENGEPAKYWGGGYRGESEEQKVEVRRCCARKCRHQFERVLTRDDWFHKGGQ